MRYRIDHRTTYVYGSDVMHSHHLLHLVPRPSSWQQCLESSIQVLPAPHRRVDYFDAFGNPVTRIELAQPHQELSVRSKMLIDVFPRPIVPADGSRSWEQVRDACTYRRTGLGLDALEAARFRYESPHVRLKGQLLDYAQECFAAGRPILSCAGELCDRMFADLTYAPGETTISTSVLEVLERKRGVCQDFAHLMIACLRARGLPARYVSGYLRTHPPRSSAGPGKAPARGATDKPALIGAGATHAWVAVWCPPFGWVELDPTNGGFAGKDHVALAWGRDFSDVSPLRGVILGGAAHELAVQVVVEPVAEEG
ncbi:MAG: transglutaminase family protein [Steroidobacteraceae bacterium]